MAKKKKDEIEKLEFKSKKTEDTDMELLLVQNPLNGKGVGVYYDETLKKYVLATLSLSPESDSAIITNKKVLKASLLGASMEAEIALKQLLQKELK